MKIKLEFKHGFNINDKNCLALINDAITRIFGGSICGKKIWNDSGTTVEFETGNIKKLEILKSNKNNLNKIISEPFELRIKSRKKNNPVKKLINKKQKNIENSDLMGSLIEFIDELDKIKEDNKKIDLKTSQINEKINLGGIKIGSGLFISPDGTLSIDYSNIIDKISFELSNEYSKIKNDKIQKFYNPITETICSYINNS